MYKFDISLCTYFHLTFIKYPPPPSPRDHMMLLWFGSTLIVFSLLERQLVGWSTTRGEIVNVCCHGDHIYMVANDGEDIYKLSIQSLRSTLLSLAARNFYAQVVKVCSSCLYFYILIFYIHIYCCM